MKVYKREDLLTWKFLFFRLICVFMRGHKFPRELESWSTHPLLPFIKLNKKYRPILGRRSDLVCLRCGVIFYTKKNYKKGKHRK